MKIRLLVPSLLILLLAEQTPGQGTVTFMNGPGTLISAGASGQQTAIAGPAGSYYFGLLIASPGITEPTQFMFSGIYATNVGTPFPGQINGGESIGVPGWAFTSTMSFFVAGWSSSLGHDWNQQWLASQFGAPGYFGVSSIATGTSGGPGLPPYVPLPLFGGPTGIQTGFDLLPVPEPSVLSLGVAGGALLLARFYRRVRSLPGRKTKREDDSIKSDQI